MESSPGLADILTRWSIDPLWIPLAIAAMGAYGFAFRRARKRGFPHPVIRMVSFVAGIGLVLLAVLSPIEHYSGQLLWVDFTGFLLLTMIAPPLILLSSPLTLAFRSATPVGRKRLRKFYRSKPFVIVTFPVATWLIFAIATYLWQFTGLTELAARNAIVRDVQQTSLLLVGLLFWLPALAPDPLRWRLAYPLRSLYVFVEMTHKGLFGGMFLSMTNAIHSEFGARAPSWAPSPITDQRIAILILWIGGNLIFLVALVGILFRWVAYEQRNQQRTDHRLKVQREAAKRRRAALDRVFEKPI